MDKVGVIGVMIKLGHVALQAVGHSFPGYPEMTDLTLVSISLGNQSLAPNVLPRLIILVERIRSEKV